MKSLRSQLTGLSALLILLIAIKPVHGQELRATEDSALLEVHVTNFDNEPHKGITVIFEGQKTGATYKGVSDENGRFSILLPEGDTRHSTKPLVIKI